VQFGVVVLYKVNFEKTKLYPCVVEARWK